MGLPTQDPVYGTVEKMTPGELQAVGLGPPGPLAAPQKPQAAPGTTPTPVAGSSSRGPLFSSPKGFYGPGVLANLESRLTGKTPEQTYEQRVPQLEAASQILGSVLAPNPASLLGRMGVQGGVAAGGAALGGKSPLEIAGQGVLGAGGQAAVEVPFQGLRLALNARKAAQAGKGIEAGKQAYEQEVKGLRGKYAEDIRTGRATHAQEKQRATAEHEAATTKQETEHAANVRAHAQQSASSIAKDYATKVGPWKDFSRDERGLISMLYGRGPKVVSKEFDKAMEKVVSEGRGKTITLSEKDATALGFEAPAASPFMTPAAREVLGRAGKLPPGLEGNISLPADKVAEAAVGAWKKDRGLYRRVVSAMDKEGLGDPAAREMYKTAHGFMDYADKSGMIRYDRNIGKYVFDPEKALEAGAKRPTLRQLTNRGLGDIDTATAIQQSMGGPLKPTPPTRRVVPPYVPPAKPQMPAPPPQSVGELPGYKMSNMTGPAVGSALGHIGGYGVGSAIGHPWLGLITGGALGGLAGKAAFPHGIVTQAPLDPKLIELLTRSPSLLNALIRNMK